MSAHGGSRRQEAQRMGRILRAKKGYFNCYTLKRIPHGHDCMIYIPSFTNYLVVPFFSNLKMLILLM